MAQSNAVNTLAYLQSRRLTPAATLALYVAAVCVAWAERRRSRIALHNLDDHMLKDIGLTRTIAEAESRRPFWQY
ncbi:MAG: DUF1127 domain-containing protein [Pseudomonadota bacterium]